MTRAEWEALIARIEAAGWEDQAPWMKRAVDAVWQARWITDATWHHAEKLLRVGAYLDAAASLVPEDATYDGAGKDGVGGWWATVRTFGGQRILGRGKTEPNARTVAAMRAQMAMQMEGDG